MVQAYRAKVDADNAAKRERGARSRDIAPGYPGPGNENRRESCRRDLERFCRTYFAAAFPLPFSKDHKRVIARLEACVLEGGLFGVGMPRGSGKTTLIERAALWAILEGHRRFVVPVGATEAAAEAVLKRMKAELFFNELLAEDYPNVCYPLRRLEQIVRRAAGQHFGGEPTLIECSARRLVLPTMPDGACHGRPNVGGAAVAVVGLTGALRGLSHALADGGVIRPDLALLDDVQTRESGMSPAQTAERLAIVNGDVLGLAGPGRKIAAVAAVTVIRSGDLADQLLSRDLNPQWQGERTKAVYAWPAAEELWEQYLRTRAEGLRAGKGTKAAKAFYRRNRKAMDAGAVVAWRQRFNPDEVSAVQHLVNLRADIGDAAFASEYQNAPHKAESDDVPVLTAEQIAAKVNGVARSVVPLAAAHLTAFVDVHDNLLFFAVVAWAPDFTGWVVTYGAYPDQRRRQFTLRKAAPTLADATPGAGREGAIRAGLVALTGELLGHECRREDGTVMRVGRCLIDAGYVPDVVYDVCRHSPHAALLLPSRGVGVGAVGRPMSEYQRRPGELHGHHWLIARTANRMGKHCRFDSNAWKTFVHARLATALGDPGCLSLYGHKPEEHRLLAEHLTAERPVRVTANGRTVEEWGVRPGVADNHWLDVLVGCAVAASQLGCVLGASASGPARKPAKHVSFRELQDRARARREGRAC